MIPFLRLGKRGLMWPMAVGAGEKRVVVRNGEAAVATVMSVTLSVNHRAIDGAVGAELLTAVKNLLERPLSLVA